MLYILIAIISSVIGSYLLIGSGIDAQNGLIMVIGIVLFILSCISSIVYGVVGWNWLAAEQKANIINRRFGTTYTQKEIFYAENIISSIVDQNENTN